MCLDVVHSEKPKSTGVGYKVFKKKGRLLFGDFTTGNRKTKTWLLARKPRRAELVYYSHGFHIFKTLSAAVAWMTASVDVVRKVKYRKAHIQGSQFEDSIVVADEIYIYPGEVR